MVPEAMPARSPPPAPPGALRQVLVVAGLDLAEAWRSRRTVAFLSMYAVLTLGATWGFLSALLQAERSAARVMGVPPPSRPGTLIDAVIDAKQIDLLGPVFGGVENARAMMAAPLVATFTFWLCLHLVPVLVVLTCHDAAASDLGSGKARFALVRVSRARWAVGRLLGQVSLTAVALSAAFLGAILLAGFRMADFHWGATLLHGGRFLGRTMVMAFAWVGPVLGISLALRSTWVARTSAFGLLILAAVGGRVLQAGQVRALAPTLVALLEPLFPLTHADALYSPDAAERLSAMFMLLVLGGVGFCAGLAVLLWRDA